MSNSEIGPILRINMFVLTTVGTPKHIQYYKKPYLCIVNLKPFTHTHTLSVRRQMRILVAFEQVLQQK